MVEAEHRLLTDGLGVNHLRLVMGTSMGGMHTWLWGERYPDFMDALMPLASLPAQISGPQPRLAPRGDRRDPQRSGVEGRRLRDAAAEPAHGRADAVARRQQSRSFAQRQIADARRRRTQSIDDVRRELRCKTGDANDMLYALESSRDYDPGPTLEKITRAAARDQLRRLTL